MYDIRMCLILSLEEELCNLYRIEGGALLYLVTTDKQVKALLVLAGDITADTPHKYVVLCGGIQRGREPDEEMKRW